MDRRTYLWFWSFFVAFNLWVSLWSALGELHLLFAFLTLFIGGLASILEYRRD